MTASRQTLLGITCLAILLGVLVLIPSACARPAVAPNAIAAPADSSDASLPQGASGDWLSNVQESIRLSEYEITWQEQTALVDLPAAYQAPNRAQNLRTYFTDTGTRVIPRTEGDHPWELGLTITGCGYGGAMETVESAKLSTAGNRMEYKRGNITEWYVNDDNGVEQGFTVTSPPRRQADSAGNLILEMKVSGDLSAQLTADARAVEFFTPGGVRVLQYDGLQAYDSAGRRLPALLSVSGSTLSISVDDAAAIYPVEIDPLLGKADWAAEGDQDGAHFGWSVATAGDVNGDGYDDLVIGAPDYERNTEGGRAYVFHGSATGLSTMPNWLTSGNQSHAQYGHCVGSAGDVNGDGYDDVIVGSYGTNRAHLYLGSPSGLSATANWTAYGSSVGTAGDVNDDGYADVIIGAPGSDQAYLYLGSASGLNTTANWTTECDRDGAFFGYSVGTAGDVDGDGYADVVIGAPRYSDNETWEGRAFVYHGSPTGLSAVPDWVADGDQHMAWFGYSVGTAGDVNDDSYDDVVIGAPRYDSAPEEEDGKACVYYGSASGLTAAPGWTGDGEMGGAWFGWSVASAGDINGDGYADVAIGAQSGPVYFCHGSPIGLSTMTAQRGSGPGHAVATAGDVNGDGFDDVVAGIPYYGNGEEGTQFQEGMACVYFGSPTPFTWMADSNRAYADFGVSVGAAGDVNADGYQDVIVGADMYNQSGFWGAAFAYHGSTFGLDTSPSWTAMDTWGDMAYAQFGFSVGTAGDVNGDGYDDVIVGGPGYNGGCGQVYVHYGSPYGLSTYRDWTIAGTQAGAFFGCRVATAGDVNGDGYDDVLVGQPLYSNDQTYEGRAYVYCGSASGLSTSPDWILEGNAQFGLLGISGGSAGDVNGDGYDDVIVGRPNLSETAVGNAYLFYGSVTGLSTSPDWTGVGSQQGALYGASVSIAGDVNSDNYSDVIIGESGYSNGQLHEGRACVYYGSASGPSAVPDWIAEGNQENCSFGEVNTAGDVNGDGYDDVVIGAPNYSNGHTEEGRVFVFHGSASGLSTSPSRTAEGNQAEAYFGASLGTAGDINSDGYADIIVGAPGYDHGETDEGRAYVFYGSADGIVLPTDMPPTAHGDIYAVNEDSILIAAATGVLDNDSYIESNAPTVLLVSNVTNGTLELNPDGSFTYTPSTDFNGTDSFSYLIRDDWADSNISTVTITVNPVDDAPAAVDDAYSLNEDGVLTIPASGVLGNDSDVEGDPLAAVLVSNVSHGTLTLSANGSFTYTPAANFNGTDSFTYKVNDGTMDSSIAKVTIKVNPVNDAPVASDDAYITAEDESLTVPASGVVGNDSDVEGGTLTAMPVSNVSHGIMTLNTDGSFTYAPAANFSGTDYFTYRVSDGSADSNVATVTITVIARPRVESTFPLTGLRGDRMEVTVLGSALSDTTSVTFGRGVTVNKFTVDDPTQITAVITVAHDAKTGIRGVSVTTPGGTCTLANALVVDDRRTGGQLIWVLIPTLLAVAGLSFSMFCVMWRTASQG